MKREHGKDQSGVKYIHFSETYEPGKEVPILPHSERCDSQLGIVWVALVNNEAEAVIKCLGCSDMGVMVAPIPPKPNPPVRRYR
jgi:hypothetical protein